MAVFSWDHPGLFVNGLAARAADTRHLDCKISTARDDRYHSQLLTGIMTVMGLLRVFENE